MRANQPKTAIQVAVVTPNRTAILSQKLNFSNDPVDRGAQISEQMTGAFGRHVNVSVICFPPLLPPPRSHYIIQRYLKGRMVPSN